MKKGTAKKAKSKAGKKEPPAQQKKVPKLTKAQLRAVEDAKLQKERNRNRMVTDATVLQTRKLQAISVEDLHRWFNLRARPQHALGQEDDAIYIEGTGNQKVNSLFHPEATHSISHERSESPPQNGGRRLSSLDIAPWGAAESKTLNKEVWETTEFTGAKSISTAKQQSKSAFSLKKPSGQIDDTVSQLGHQTLLHSQLDSQGPIREGPARMPSHGQGLVTLDLQKHSASIFHPPKNFDSTLNTDERRANATALSHAIKRTRHLMVGRPVPQLRDIMPKNSGQIKNSEQK